MNPKLNGISRQYQAALREHLRQGPRASLQPAQGLGRRAVTLGLDTLDLARVHERTLIKLVLPRDTPATRETVVRRAGLFFARAITPIEQIHRIAVETGMRQEQLNRALRRRRVELAASNRKLKQEIALRKLAEKALVQSKQHYGQLLEQSGRMQEQLRYLSRQLLSAQEEERKKISRELHDVIAQTLTSINVRLAGLKKKAVLNSSGLERSIARTQRLVEHSVSIVHRFARELRPTVLDDLGLIPALHTFMKTFTTETGIRVSLSAFAGLEQVNGEKRTVLYRVAQEALTNVARHAHASHVEVKIQKQADAICMRIKDNGKGFLARSDSHPKKDKRLGLLGMRERLDMVGGSLTVTSTPGKGTTVLAQLPIIDRDAFGDGRSHAARTSTKS